ncbi:MAG TPA: hypothetical protein VGW76_16955 [Pyrinomonadaceae bacterium]|nr:hypothetical protein [Pyrinomonadaceae bacterium]
MADTVNYAESILAHMRGEYVFFLEFHHLLWRPIGWLSFMVIKPLAQWASGTADGRVGVVWTLMALNWLAGLGAVILVRALLVLFCRRDLLADIIAFTFVLSNGFLNYSQAGTSYISGLCLLLLCFYLLLKSGKQEKSNWLSGVGAGLALAGTLSLWAPYVLAAPAALLSPLLFCGFDKTRFRLTLVASITCALVAGAIFGSVALYLGLVDTAGFRQWMGISSVSGSQINGIARVLFGFPRSIMNMGQDAPLFKRYLVHDPFNPVSLPDLVQLSLWKLGLFYVFLAAMLGSLLFSSRGRRVFALFLLNAFPVVLFAIFFYGADMERYLGLYPTLFISLGCALCSDKARTVLKWLALLFLAAVAISNIGGASKIVLQKQEEKVFARIKDLQPVLKPQSYVVTVDLSEELSNFNRTYLFNPVNIKYQLRIYSLLSLNTAQVTRWRESFAVQALSIWQGGGEVWVTKRVKSPIPRSEWNWVEGDDPQVSWTDVHKFFESLEMSASVGGDDGFLLLSASPENERLLRVLADNELRGVVK